MMLNQPLLYADRVNKNKRVYSMRVVEKMCFEAQEAVRERRFPCTLGNPPDSVIPFKDMCGLVTRLDVAGNALCADIELIDTPCGKIVKNMISGGGRVAFRTFGVGTGHVDENEIMNINSDYKLLGVACLPPEEAS